MAIIVNSPKNLPFTIKVAELTRFNEKGIHTEYLDRLVQNPTNEVGIKTRTYYMINTAATLRSVFNIINDAERMRNQRSQFFLRSVMDYCTERGYKLLMIKF